MKCPFTCLKNPVVDFGAVVDYVGCFDPVPLTSGIPVCGEPAFVVYDSLRLDIVGRIGFEGLLCILPPLSFLVLDDILGYVRIFHCIRPSRLIVHTGSVGCMLGLCIWIVLGYR